MTGVVRALGLLATAGVCTRLLATGPTPDRVVAALPALAVVVAALAGRGLLDALAGAAQAALAPRVRRRAEDELYVALIGVDLVAFDEPDFTQLVDRVTVGAPLRPKSAVTQTSALTALAISAAAAIVTAGLLHPVLAPVVLLAAVPRAWAQIKRVQLEFGSWLRTPSGARRLAVAGNLISERDNAPEVRAFTAQDALLAEHRRIADDLLDEAVRVGLEQNRASTTGRGLAGIGSGISFGVLGLLLPRPASCAPPPGELRSPARRVAQFRVVSSLPVHARSARSAKSTGRKAQLAGRGGRDLGHRRAAVAPPGCARARPDR